MTDKQFFKLISKYPLPENSNIIIKHPTHYDDAKYLQYFEDNFVCMAIKYFPKLKKKLAVELTLDRLCADELPKKEYKSLVFQNIDMAFRFIDRESKKALSTISST